MSYLQPSDYAAYGLPSDTTDDWAAMASALIDAHCRRPSLQLTPYTERMRLTAGSQTVRLSYLPLAPTSPLTSIRVRYGRPRRGEIEPEQLTGWGSQAVMLSQVANAFGLPGSWSTLDPASLDLNPATGEVTFPANILGLPYNEVEITYNAGFATIPAALKIACAQIVRNAQATPALNVKSSRMDTLQMQYFAGSLVDATVQQMLAPYVAQRIG